MEWFNAPSIRFTLHEDWAVIDNGCELFYSDSWDECNEWVKRYMNEIH